MSLLRVEKLTMRFGGLTAVNQLDLTIEPGQIFSVIGPNGAGKTTAFNAITGIYAPTEGQILFEGKPQQRPRTGRTWAMWLLVGLVVGYLSLIIASDGDTMWKAAVRSQDTKDFSYGRAIGETMRYLRGSLIIQKAGPNYQIVAQDGSPIVATAKDDDEAYLLRDDLMAGNLLVSGNIIRDAKGERIVYEGSDPAAVQAFLNRLDQAKAESAGKTVRMIFFGVLGCILGIAGAVVVWSRSRRTADVIALSGIARTFQNIRLFQNMTVLENVLIGMDRSMSNNIVGMAIRLPFIRREERRKIREAMQFLDFVGLAGRSNDLARNLPYGDQRLLEIARAMACSPRLLLLDEPAAGMNPSETVELMHLIRKIRDRGITVLLIEHHMSLVMGISDRIAVLDYGVKIAEGTPDEVKNNQRVIEAYLGKEEVS